MHDWRDERLAQTPRGTHRRILDPTIRQHLSFVRRVINSGKHGAETASDRVEKGGEKLASSELMELKNIKRNGWKRKNKARRLKNAVRGRGKEPREDLPLLNHFSASGLKCARKNEREPY